MISGCKLSMQVLHRQCSESKTEDGQIEWLGCERTKPQAAVFRCCTTFACFFLSRHFHSWLENGNLIRNVRELEASFGFQLNHGDGHHQLHRIKCQGASAFVVPCSAFGCCCCWGLNVVFSIFSFNWPSKYRFGHGQTHPHPPTPPPPPRLHLSWLDGCSIQCIMQISAEICL